MLADDETCWAVRVFLRRGCSGKGQRAVQRSLHASLQPVPLRRRCCTHQYNVDLHSLDLPRTRFQVYQVQMRVRAREASRCFVQTVALTFSDCLRTAHSSSSCVHIKRTTSENRTTESTAWTMMWFRGRLYLSARTRRYSDLVGIWKSSHLPGSRSVACRAWFRLSVHTHYSYLPVCSLFSHSSKVCSHVRSFPDCTSRGWHRASKSNAIPQPAQWRSASVPDQVHANKLQHGKRYPTDTGLPTVISKPQ